MDRPCIMLASLPGPCVLRPCIMLASSIVAQVGEGKAVVPAAPMEEARGMIDLLARWAVCERAQRQGAVDAAAQWVEVCVAMHLTVECSTKQVCCHCASLDVSAQLSCMQTLPSIPHRTTSMPT